MSDLTKIALPASSKEYQVMLENIARDLPMIREACGHFGKTQSQFMDNFLTIAYPTPLRNCHQILAQLAKSTEALSEAQYKAAKRKLTIKKILRDLETETDEIKIEELHLEYARETSLENSSQIYIQGQVRACANYIEQYETILKNAGYEKITEEDFEAEEEKYHIMRAFDQAICAARSRNGIIDEGNHIYFSQIGINGRLATSHIQQFFVQELEHLKNHQPLDHHFLADFLEDMAKVFKGCSQSVAERKGQAMQTTQAILRRA